MPIPHRMLGKLAGDDAKMRRLVTYWAATVLLYVLSIGILWVEVISGAARVEPVLALTMLAVTGHTVFYVLIRRSAQWNLPLSQLSVYQGRFAIFCAVVGYTVMGPLRGATLIVLTVILVFCAFTLEARKTHSLSIFAIVLLGIAMMSMAVTSPLLFDAKTELIHFILTGSVLFVVGILTGRLSELRSTLIAQKAELASALAQIQTLATHDDLTSLPNRRYMGDLLQREERRQQDASASACIALIDIDWFKKINDGHGHAAGDEVLRKFAEESRRNLREHDVLARWGGEEFLLYLPETTLDAANATIERLRQHIQSLNFHADGASFGITFSAGLVQLLPGDTIDLGIRRADVLLYRAKAEGRNRVASAPAPATVPG